MRPSMGSVGDAYDNAMCESFFAMGPPTRLRLREVHAGGQLAFEQEWAGAAGLGLVRTVAAEHAKLLGLDLKVTLFTQSGAGSQADILRLIECLEKVSGVV